MPQITVRAESVTEWRNETKFYEFVNILNSAGRFMKPEKFDRKEPVKIVFESENPQCMDQLLEIWNSKYHWVHLNRKGPFPSWMTVQMYPAQSNLFNEIISGIDTRYFKKDEDIKELYHLAKQLFSWGACVHGYICHDDEWQSKNVFDTPTEVTGGLKVFTGGTSLKQCLPGVYWANYFGPLYVNYLGREKFLSMPAYSKEELPDGGFMVLTAESPFEYRDQKVQDVETAILKHLGREYFFEKSNPRKPLRAPNFGFGQNSPPQAIDLISGFIPDVKDFIENSSQLSDDLKNVIPSLDYSPESLKIVDNYLLKYTKKFSPPWNPCDRLLIKQLAAYFGEVLKKDFDGAWQIEKGCTGKLHPAISFMVGGKGQIEFPFVRVIKLWIEREKTDGLFNRFTVIREGKVIEVEKSISSFSP